MSAPEIVYREPSTDDEGSKLYLRPGPGRDKYIRYDLAEKEREELEKKLAYLEDRCAKCTIHEDVAAKDKEIEKAKERLRATAQTLIGCIGSDGPENAEHAADRAVAEIERLTPKASEYVGTCTSCGHAIYARAALKGGTE